MKKSVFIVSIFIFMSLVIFNIAHASSGAGKKAFGGIIIDEEAARLTELESTGYNCAVPGDTFDIKPVGKSSTGPYLVPPGVTARGGGTPAPGRWVLGLYNLTPTIVTCINDDPYIPPVTVNLFPITIFGVSRS